MAYDDRSPERRNLTLVSLAFIAYFFGGGQFTDEKITLLVVSVDFTKGWVLALLAWLILFWFLWRYWMANRNQLTDMINGDLEHPETKNAVISRADLVLERIAAPYTKVPDRVNVASVSFVKWFFKVNYRFSNQDGTLFTPSNFLSEVKGSPQSIYLRSAKPNIVIVELRGELWMKNSLPILVHLTTNHPTITAYFFPYILFSLAFLGGLWSLISSFV